MTEQRDLISEEDYWLAVGRYEPSWISTDASNVVGYGIDKQTQLPSGKIQVTFSTVEALPDQNDEDDSTCGYRFVCTVALNETKGRWVIEGQEEPVKT